MGSTERARIGGAENGLRQKRQKSRKLKSVKAARNNGRTRELPTR